MKRVQGQLFTEDALVEIDSNENDLLISKDLLTSWQKNIQNSQARLFNGDIDSTKQFCFFETKESKDLDGFNPLEIAPLPMNFWQLPNKPHSGPAIYLVMDLPEGFKTPILLYIGETVSADLRWKGDHDCKEYIASYSQALSKVGLNSNLNIRFWTDVPKTTKARRKLEQKLIQLWLPPFNKETRNRWSTPFTSDIK